MAKSTDNPSGASNPTPGNSGGADGSGGADAPQANAPTRMGLPTPQDRRPRKSLGSDLGASLRDRYNLIRVLGKGGFGIVYLAHDRILDQDVAIKVMKLANASRADRQRFIFEARTGAKLRHHAIVNVFDIIQTEEGLQLVMEYYPGGTISQLVKKKGPLSPKKAFNYIREVATGLAYAHSKGIIHRDIKPANMFLAAGGRLKLGDFGIAAQYETHENTMTGDVMGTPMYMAPEQTRDSKDVDPRSDLYALGMTLYHMLTGRPPRVVELDQFDPEIRRFLRKATAYERGKRPVSANQMIVMIDQTLEEIEGKRLAKRATAAQLARDNSPEGGDGSDADDFTTQDDASAGSSSSPPTGPGEIAGPDDQTITQTPLSPPGGNSTPATTDTPTTSATGVHWSVMAFMGVLTVVVLGLGVVLIGVLKDLRQTKSQPGIELTRPFTEPLATPTDEVPTGDAPQVEFTPKPELSPDPTPAAPESTPKPTALPSPTPAPTPPPRTTPSRTAETTRRPRLRPSFTPAPAITREDIQNRFQRRQEMERVPRLVRALRDYLNDGSPFLRNSLTQSFENASARMSDNLFVQYILYRLYHSAGEDAQATEQRKKVEAIDPDFFVEEMRNARELFSQYDLGQLSAAQRERLFGPSPARRR